MTVKVKVIGTMRVTAGCCHTTPYNYPWATTLKFTFSFFICETFELDSIYTPVVIGDLHVHDCVRFLKVQIQQYKLCIKIMFLWI